MEQGEALPSFHLFYRDSHRTETVGSAVQETLALGSISDPTNGTTSRKSLNTSEVCFLFGKIKKIDSTRMRF